ncbi:hypothetical protein HLH33_00545 [Gluconacetobacter diazotrophicus]|uniref:Uncharacterized protein n=1 Tax=Gluconacetobacter diazotrophicus TaxID=33996 RepID=A0A7W4FBQ9_GLUDI|nr:hypothetical protein [Gluconacetobacter diazotrophicus]MBB2154809.1 hypothetical protein [Gluconacetobacter diazotrophicus]
MDAVATTNIDNTVAQIAASAYVDRSRTDAEDFCAAIRPILGDISPEISVIILRRVGWNGRTPFRLGYMFKCAMKIETKVRGVRGVSRRLLEAASRYARIADSYSTNEKMTKKGAAAALQHAKHINPMIDANDRKALACQYNRMCAAMMKISMAFEIASHRSRPRGEWRWIANAAFRLRNDETLKWGRSLITIDREARTIGAEPMRLE